MKVQRIERIPGGGLRVVMADGSVATYASSASLPDEITRLIARMDAAGGDGDGGEPQGDAEAAQAAYQRRLESAWQQGQTRTNPGDGVSGLDGYRQRLESGWQQETRKPKLPKAKHWRGA